MMRMVSSNRSIACDAAVTININNVCSVLRTLSE
jgi:hypothetical protein